MDVLAVIKKAICDVHTEVEQARIIPSANFYQDLEMDSLSMIELTLALEDRLGVIIPDEEMDNIKTVGELSNYLKTKLGQ